MFSYQIFDYKLTYNDSSPEWTKIVGLNTKT